MKAQRQALTPAPHPNDIWVGMSDHETRPEHVRYRLIDLDKFAANLQTVANAAGIDGYDYMHAWVVPYDPRGLAHVAIWGLTVGHLMPEEARRFGMQPRQGWCYVHRNADGPWVSTYVEVPVHV